MSIVIPLFDSILSSLIESIVPLIQQEFSDIDSKITSGKIKNPDYDLLFCESFSFFPKESTYYHQMISTLTNVAIEYSNDVLVSLSSKFKSETLNKRDSSLSIISSSSLGPYASTKSFLMYSRGFTLIFLSDLIESILKSLNLDKKLSKSTPIGKIVQCGYFLCTPMDGYPCLQERLLTQWSCIFYLLSFENTDEISQYFVQNRNESNISNIYLLISHIKANQSFIDSLLFMTHEAFKRKYLSSSMLVSLSILLSNSECDQEIIDEFFMIAWNCRNTKNLKFGAIELIASLFPMSPKNNKKISTFYNSRVFEHTSNQEKVARSARAFLRLIQGNISKVKRISYENIECIGCKGDYDQFISDFLKYFFGKANFVICPILLRDIMVHIMSLDFEGFFESILPYFLALDAVDSRYIVLLMTVPLMNSNEFSQNAFSKPNKDAIESFNRSIRQSIINQMPLFMTLLENKIPKNALRFSEAYQNPDRNDNYILTFLNSNYIDSFSPIEFESTIKTEASDEMNPFLHLMKAIVTIMNPSDFENGSFARLIIQCSSSGDPGLVDFIKSTASSILKCPNCQKLFVFECIRIIRETKSVIIQECCLAFIYHILKSACDSIHQSIASDIEIIAFIMLSSINPNIRYLSLSILKIISQCNLGECYIQLYKAKEYITSEANRVLLVIIPPDFPSQIKTLTGSLDFEIVCFSRYNTLWMIFFAKCMDILIMLPNKLIIKGLADFFENKGQTKIVENIEKRHHLMIEGQLLLMFDSFVYNDLDQEAVKTYDICVRATSYLLTSKSEKMTRAFLSILNLLHWRVIPSIICKLLEIKSEFYSQLTRYLALAIQNPEIFSHVLASIFSSFLDFLSIIESHFVFLKINSPKTIVWDKNIISLVKAHESLIVNYCIIVAAAFNNISDQLPEEEWPLSSRQILVQYLMQWAQLPEGFEKIKAYSINALIPILSIGSVFSHGFSCELWLIEKMIECQLEGYYVLDSLLIYHPDILLSEFIKFVFYKPKLVSQLFQDSILNALNQIQEKSVFSINIGYIILFIQFIFEKRPKESFEILKSLAGLFMDAKALKIIDGFSDLSFLSELFEFATEKVIEAGLCIIKHSKQTATARKIAKCLDPWFLKLRILPSHGHIVNGVTSEFRSYNVISFIESMMSISLSLAEEHFDIFSKLWKRLMSVDDNSMIVLICLFDLKDSKSKQMIFLLLLEHITRAVIKFLAKRCMFSFWYFLHNYRKQDINEIMWIMPVLIRAFSENPGIAGAYFTPVFHFSLLFFEKTQPLYETLFGVFGPSVTDSIANSGINGAIETKDIPGIVKAIRSGLTESNSSKAIIKWSKEAMRWASCCNDITIAYRSLLILNYLDSDSDPYFLPLIKQAVCYHLANQYDEYSQLSLYLKEVFKYLKSYIANPSFLSFSFNFCSQFLGCFYFTDCFRDALPVFLIWAKVHNINPLEEFYLADAFIPYLSDLETNIDSQFEMLKIIGIADYFEISMIVAAFGYAKIPLIDVETSYEDLMAIKANPNSANRSINFLAHLSSNASDDLLSGIFTVAANLVERLKFNVKRAFLVPLCQNAIKKVAIIPAALRFLSIIARIDPSVVSLDYDPLEGSKTVQAVRNSIMKIEAVETEKVAITSCKTLDSMWGMIDQVDPPKVYPFETYQEMHKGLIEVSKIRKDTKTTNSLSRWTSTLAITSQTHSNHSLLVPASLLVSESDIGDFDVIETKDIIPQRLDLPVEMDNKWMLISSHNDFLQSFNK